MPLLEEAYLYNPDMRLAASRIQKRSRGRCASAQEKSLSDTWNNVSAEVAKNYITLRGLQHRLAIMKLAKKGLAAGSEQAEYEYQKIVLTALEEVGNAIASYHFELERHIHLGEVYHSHQQALELMQDLSKRGLKKETDLLAKKVTLFNAESELLQSQVDLLLHYVVLYKSLEPVQNLLNLRLLQNSIWGQICAFNVGFEFFANRL
jgi:outer membrane protein TolC